MASFEDLLTLIQMTTKAANQADLLLQKVAKAVDDEARRLEGRFLEGKLPFSSKGSWIYRTYSLSFSSSSPLAPLTITLGVGNVQDGSFQICEPGEHPAERISEPAEAPALVFGWLLGRVPQLELKQFKR